MKANNIIRSVAVALCLAGASGMYAADIEIPTVLDRVFINDFSIEPGQNQLLEVWLESTVSWDDMLAKFQLPKGLVMAAIDPEELPEGYSFEPVKSPKGYENMVAMSTNFCNHEFWDPSQVEEWEEKPEIYSAFGGYICYSPEPGFGIFSDLGDFTFNGTYTIALLKVHATEELAPESEMTMTESIFMTPKGVSIGATNATQVYGQPTVTHIKRHDTHSAVTDLKASGVVEGDGVYYNLMGQPMTHPTQPGIYIHNGQKVVVK